MSVRELEPGMRASSLEIVVVGLGEVAQTHLTVLKRIPDIDVVAGVCPGRGLGVIG